MIDITKIVILLSFTNLFATFLKIFLQRLIKKKARDAEGKPIILVDEEKALIIRRIFAEYIRGASIVDIRKTVAPLGYKPKGRSTIQNMLGNPVYAGLLKTRGSNKLVKGIHDSIVSEHDFWLIQERLHGKKIVSQKREEVPLRGVLRCFCGKLVTAGNSKNARGKYYWYYLCSEHKNNLSAVKLHEKFNTLLDNLSMNDDDINRIKEILSAQLGKHINERGQKLSKLQKDLKLIQGKITSAEEKFLLKPDISKKTYEKVMAELRLEESKLYKEIAEVNTNVEVYYQRLNELLPKIGDLKTAFNAMDLTKQQQFINVVFDNSLYYANESYRTPKLLELFSHKELELKEKGLLFVEQPSVNLGETPLRSENEI